MTVFLGQAFDAAPECSPIQQAIVGSFFLTLPHLRRCLLLENNDGIAFAGWDPRQVIVGHRFQIAALFELFEIFLLPLAQDIHFDLEMDLHLVYEAIDSSRGCPVIQLLVDRLVLVILL